MEFLAFVGFIALGGGTVFLIVALISSLVNPNNSSKDSSTRNYPSQPEMSQNLNYAYLAERDRWSFGNANIQRQINKARNYKEEINRLVKAASGNRAQGLLQRLTPKVNDWIETIRKLAKSVEVLQKNTVIQKDLRSVRRTVKSLQKRIKNEKNKALRTELKRSLEARKNHLDILHQMQNTIKRTEIKIERAVSLLGTIYSQLVMASHINDYSSIDRLLTDVDEEIRTLQDHHKALVEVKLGKARLFTQIDDKKKEKTNGSMS